jgi:hypothetical protein
VADVVRVVGDEDVVLDSLRDEVCRGAEVRAVQAVDVPLVDGEVHRAAHVHVVERRPREVHEEGDDAVHLVRVEPRSPLRSRAIAAKQPLGRGAVDDDVELTGVDPLCEPDRSESLAG